MTSLGTLVLVALGAIVVRCVFAYVLALRALARSEANFETVIESARDCVCFYRDQVVRYANPSMLSLLGVLDQAALHDAFGQPRFVHADDRVAFASFLRSRELAKVVHVRWVARGGLIRVMSVRKSAIVQEDGPTWMLVARDVTDSLAAATEYVRAGEARRLSEERYRVLFEGTPLPITLFDPETLRITEVNEAAVRLYGYTREEFATKTIDDLDGSPSKPARAAVKSGRFDSDTGKRRAVQPWHAVRKHAKKDGTPIEVEITAHPLLMDDRQIMLAIGTDVSERRRLEERVQQSQKMEAIGSLAGGVAHDFNNILSVILGYSEVLLMDLSEDDPKRPDLEEIARAGERAADLTRQLLAFGRQQVLQPRVIDLHAVVGGMEKMLRRLLGEDVALVVPRARAKSCARLDPGQIEQVIMNLAVNARDAMPNGGTLTIETTEVMVSAQDAVEMVGISPGPHVMLSVTDTGMGMDKATQARMFEPFFTTKGVGKGTGLGLATVFGIVQQSGGAIRVDSEPGHGTTMRVCFPATACAVEASPRLPVSAVMRAVRGAETILLVEDDEAVRALTRSALRQLGYNVLEAQNAGEALLMCEQHDGKIDLLLTDVVMPRISGSQLAARLTAMRPEMRVLYMSGYTADEVVRHGVVESTISFIQKPITPHTLANKIREVLGPQSQRSVESVR